MKKLSLLSAMFVVFALYSGCKYNGGPDVIVPGKTMPPKSGSSFTYNNTPIDTTGKLLTDSAFTTEVTIGVTDTTYSGKTQVTRFSSKNLKTGVVTSTFINYEDNGDISEYFGGSVFSFLGIKFPDWFTYPIQSHTTSAIKVADDTLTVPVSTGVNVTVHIVVWDSISYMKDSTYKTAQGTLGIYMFRHTTSYNGEIILIKGFPGLPFSSSTVSTISFAPAIGYYAETYTMPTISPIGIIKSVNGSDMKLLSYILK